MYILCTCINKKKYQPLQSRNGKIFFTCRDLNHVDLTLVCIWQHKKHEHYCSAGCLSVSKVWPVSEGEESHSDSGTL